MSPRFIPGARIYFLFETKMPLGGRATFSSPSSAGGAHTLAAANVGLQIPAHVPAFAAFPSTLRSGSPMAFEPLKRCSNSQADKRTSSLPTMTGKSENLLPTVRERSLRVPFWTEGRFHNPGERQLAALSTPVPPGAGNPTSGMKNLESTSPAGKLQ